MCSRLLRVYFARHVPHVINNAIVEYHSDNATMLRRMRRNLFEKRIIIRETSTDEWNLQ